MTLQKETQLPITPAETKLSLTALRRKLIDASPYSYGYDGTPDYIHFQITSIHLRLQRLIAAVKHLEITCPAKFYKRREVIKCN